MVYQIGDFVSSVTRTIYSFDGFIHDLQCRAHSGRRIAASASFSLATIVHRNQRHFAVSRAFSSELFHQQEFTVTDDNYFLREFSPVSFAGPLPRYLNRRNPVTRG